MRRSTVPTYEETGIAIPPKFECICGKECKNLTRHHNAFDETYYRNPPHVRKEASRALIELFRSSMFNRFWVPRCAHNAIHPTGDERVRAPRLEVIEGFLDESIILNGLNHATRGINNSNKRISDWGPERDKESLESIYERLDRLQQQRQEQLTKLSTITIIPEEVVTGALLIAAPEVGARRLVRSPERGIVAPLNWPKREVLSIVEMYSSSEALQTGVDTVQLAA